MNSLIRKAKRHDKDSFAELILENNQSMYKVAKAILKNDEDVADAIQETILVCWEKIGTLKKDNYFKTWLIRILINHCNAIYKQRMKYVPNNQIPETVEPRNEYANIEWMELLKYLEEKYRTVIILYYVEGFKVREIAQILELSESAVKGRMVTARKEIESFYQFGKEWKAI